MKDSKTVVRVLEAIITTYGLGESARECVKQAIRAVITLDRLNNTNFMQNASKKA